MGGSQRTDGRSEDDREMRKAFLVGADLRPGSTPNLIEGAASVQQAWQDETFHERAIALGITKAMVDKLVAGRRALIAANTGQHEQMNERAGTSAQGRSALRSVERETAHVRRVAKLAFRGQPKILAAFAKKTVRAIARSRKTPPPGPQATT